MRLSGADGRAVAAGGFPSVAPSRSVRARRGAAPRRRPRRVRGRAPGPIRPLGVGGRPSASLGVQSSAVPLPIATSPRRSRAKAPATPDLTVPRRHPRPPALPPPQPPPHNPQPTPHPPPPPTPPPATPP